MTEPRRRHRWRIAAAAVAASACLIPALTGSATGDNLSQLRQKLGSAQSQLNSNQQREQSLTSQLDALSGRVTALSSQIQLVQSREDDARARLSTFEARLAAARAAVGRERRHLTRLHRVLSRARSALAAQLRGVYERPRQSFVSLLVDAKGFQELLDSLQYLSIANKREQAVITVTREARALARRATAHLLVLEHSDASAADAAQTQTNALAGMGALLNSQQSALADERAAQSAALAASQAQGVQLQSAVATIQKQEQAARQAEQTVSYSDGGGLGASAGWAIPYKIVLCESGGANLPPNGAGASGYYQILPSTWREFGGSGAAAYLASKSEQDAVASRIWNGGAGASNWSCSAITGVN